MKKKGNIILLVVLAGLLLLIWEFAARGTDAELFISFPSKIVAFLVKNISFLLQSTAVTLVESLIGLIIATLFSFALMDIVLPLSVTSQVIPLITLAPLFALIFDIGLTAKIMMAALLCFFPIFINFANGVNLIPKSITELMQIYNISTTQKIIKFYFPLSLPSIMQGLKVSSTLAVIGAIMAEFCGAKIGLGKNLYLATKRLNPELIMSSIVLSAVLGGLLYVLVVLIENKLGYWYKQNKQ